jgi:hypothetical protein
MSQKKNPRPYGKNEYIANSSKVDKFQQGAPTLSETEFTRNEIERMKAWNTLFRLKPSLFVEWWLGIPIFPYQRYWLDLMAESTTFLAVASRGSAKSMIVGLLAIVKAILYPGIKITIASNTKKQAGLIITQYVSSFEKQSEMLAREIQNIIQNSNDYRVLFHNGSVIEVVVSGDSGRGARNSVSILEERRLIPNEIIDTIIRPFAVTYRPPYLFKKEYSHLQPMEPQEFAITSAYYKSGEWYKEAVKIFKKMAEGEEGFNCITLDYQITIRHSIKSKRQIDTEKLKFDPISFSMEYGNIPYDGSASSFYKINMFTRTLKRAWRPIMDKYATGQKNVYDIKKLGDEKRVMGVDLAMRGGRTNDLSVFTCARLIPTSKGWGTEIVYQETHSGKNATLQALRIKQIASEFDADAIIMDFGAGGNGQSVFDILSLPTKDDDRIKEYPAYTIIKHSSIGDSLYEEMVARTLGKDALPIIYPIIPSPQLNAQMSVKLRDRLKRKMIKFLCDDTIAEEYLVNSGNKDIFGEDGESRAYLLSPHVNTSLMVNECISLEMIPNASGFKLQEPSGVRKDRFSSLMYLNWYVSLMDSELLRENSEEDSFSVLASLFYSG